MNVLIYTVVRNIKLHTNKKSKVTLYELDPNIDNYDIRLISKVWYLIGDQSRTPIIMNEELDGSKIEFMGKLDSISDAQLEKIMKVKDIESSKCYFDYKKEIFDADISIQDSFRTLLDKVGIPDWQLENWGIVSIHEKDKQNESKLNEGDAGGMAGSAAGGGVANAGGAGGGGCAYAGQGSIAGMGAVVAAQPGVVPGQTGTTGSGDVGFPFPALGGTYWKGGVPNPGRNRRAKRMQGKMKPFSMSMKRDKDSTPRPSKVMSYNDFLAKGTESVTHLKESVDAKDVKFNIPFLAMLGIIDTRHLSKYRNVGDIVLSLLDEKIHWLNNKYMEFKNKTFNLSDNDQATVDSIKEIIDSNSKPFTGGGPTGGNY